MSELNETIPDTEDPTVLDDEGLGRLINDFLRGEKEHIRHVFIRRYYFGDDIAEIARMYAFSVSKVKSMLFHTRNKLKKYLIEKGVAL